MEQTAGLLVKWYRKNKRDLPWRETKDPYKVWLSEIILQQTRVEQGLPYYQRFLKEFPNIQSLANASEKKILKCWEGLGYYSRARNLHFTARYISNELGGKFPESAGGLIKLKGVGPYTAAAIASICYEESCAVVDGNVFRLLARLFGIKTSIDSLKGKRDFQKLAQEFLGSNRPSEFNQAMMEFGATYCKPQSPDCRNCVLLEKCYAGSHNKAGDYPIKEKKTAVRQRNFYYFILKYQDKVMLRERVGKDIWKGLFEFPMEERNRKENAGSVLNRFVRKRKLVKGLYSLSREPVTKVHLLSHQKINAFCFTLQLKKNLVPGKGEAWVRLGKLSDYPMPRLLHHFHSQLK